jgi:hypothetical protein
VKLTAADRERRAQVEQMIEEYRRVRQRALFRRALRLWRRTEAHQRFAAFEKQPERVH